MRYELKLAQLIEKGSRVNILQEDLPVEVLAVIGYLGSLELALRALEENVKKYLSAGDRAAIILKIPPRLMEIVVALNKSRMSPLQLIQMLRSGHLGKWRRNLPFEESFLVATEAFSVSKKAAKLN